MRRSLLKKLNRGLLLAAVLLIGVTAYVVADTISFRQETDRIEQVIREYVEQSPQMAILPSPYNKLGSPADENAVRRKMAENEELLRKYWSFRTDDQDYNQGEAILAQVQGALEYNAKGLGAISSAKGIVQYVHSIREIGFGRAEVSFSYTGSVRYIGDVQWVLFTAGRQSTGANNSVYFRSHSADVPEERISPTGDVTAILIQVDGQWKIDSVEVSSVSIN